MNNYKSKVLHNAEVSRFSTPHSSLKNDFFDENFLRMSYSLLQGFIDEFGAKIGG